MKIGDLVKDKHFGRYGIILEEPSYLFEGHRRGTSLKSLKKEYQYTWVLWDNGLKTKWKTEYLEVISENR